MCALSTLTASARVTLRSALTLLAASLARVRAAACLGLLSCWAVVPALADISAPESYRWKPVAIGGGGFITGLSADRTGATRVARADVYGAYLWLADRNRWTQLVTASSMPADLHFQNAANDGVFEVVVAPSNPERIFMAFKGRVLRSDDRGVRFVKTAPLGSTAVEFDPNSPYRDSGPFMAVDPANADLVLFATPAGGVWRSTDAGAHWQRVTLPAGRAPPTGQPAAEGGCGVLWFAPDAGLQTSTLWAAIPGEGVYISRDKGASFSRLPNSSEDSPRQLGQGAFAPDGTFFGVDRTSRSLWRYRDGAWSQLSNTAELPALAFTTLAIDDHSSHVYVFDEGGRSFVSRNLGSRWSELKHRSEVGVGDPPWLHVSNKSYFAMAHVQFDARVPGRLWAGTGTGVYYADTAGTPKRIQWVSQTRGIEEFVANDVIKPAGRAAVFAAWDFGIHVKGDLDTFSTGYGPKERVLIAAQQVAWSPADPLFLATNASDTRTGCCSGDGDAVLAGYSTDGGRSWYRFAKLPQPPGTAPSDPWRMSFGSIAVSAGDTTNIVWAPSFNRSPYYSRDRGASWSRVTLPGEVLPLTGSHSAFHLHRKTLVADREQSGTFYLVHSGDGYNATLAGLWVSDDGGARWKRAFVGEIAPYSTKSAKLRAVPGHAGHLFFTSGVYGPFDTRLRRSRDGGASWSALDGVDQVEDVAFGRAAAGAAYPAIFLAGRVAGRYGIWRSVDDAGRWQRVGGFPVGSLDQVTVIEGDPDRFGRVYLGFKGSGWAYGEPAPCTPVPYQFAANDECVAVQ